MDVLGGAGQVELNLYRTQIDEERQVNALASGLRVNSASDDPSGLAISQTIQAKVSGLQQGVQNVQNANNALSVADGALSAVQEILQRIHDLVVQAASDVNSNGDLQSIQMEIDQLLREIDKIGAGTQFNGLALLTGTFDASTPAPDGTLQVQSPLASGNPNASGSTVVNADGMGNPGPLVTLDGTGHAPTGNFTPAFVTFQVLSTGNNLVDPDSNTVVSGPGDLVRMVAYSTDPQFGGAPVMIDDSVVATGSGQLGPASYSSPNQSSPQDLFDFYLANLSPQDVGTSIAFLTYAQSATGGGQAMSINSSGTEGGDVRVSLPTISTSALNVNGISVLASQAVNYLNQPIASPGTNIYAASDAEERVQMALDQVSQARAVLGAQTISLNEDASDASVQIVNQVAAESAIRDVNIGQSAADFSKDQVLTKINLSVLSQMQVNAQLVIQLVGGAAPGLAGRI